MHTAHSAPLGIGRPVRFWALHRVCKHISRHHSSRFVTCFCKDLFQRKFDFSFACTQLEQAVSLSLNHHSAYTDNGCWCTGFALVTDIVCTFLIPLEAFSFFGNIWLSREDVFP